MLQHTSRAHATTQRQVLIDTPIIKLIYMQPTVKFSPTLYGNRKNQQKILIIAHQTDCYPLICFLASWLGSSLFQYLSSLD